MADASATPPGGDPWTEASRRYWDAWTRGWQPSGAAPDFTVPWADAADRWWKLMNPPPPPDSRALFDQLLEQGKTFLRFGEAFTASLSHSGGAFQSPDEWARAVRSIVESWQAGLAAPADAGLAAFWTLPFDTWSRTASSASVFPGDFLEAHKPEAWSRLADGLHRDLERFLSVPGLGYSREVQEQGQELMRLGLEYQRAVQAYLLVFRELGPQTVERLQGRLTERAERNEPITTLRGLYDIWVDSSEEAYLEVVSTDGYAQAYGRMVNALMALKNHGRNMVDEGVGSLGLPTRHGLNTLQQRLQELRREVVRLRREVSAMDTLRSELAELREQVGRLRSEAGPGVSARARRPRRAAKASRQRPEER